MAENIDSIIAISAIALLFFQLWLFKRTLDHERQDRKELVDHILKISNLRQDPSPSQPTPGVTPESTVLTDEQEEELERLRLTVPGANGKEKTEVPV